MIIKTEKVIDLEGKIKYRHTILVKATPGRATHRRVTCWYPRTKIKGGE